MIGLRDKLKQMMNKIFSLNSTWNSVLKFCLEQTNTFYSTFAMNDYNYEFDDNFWLHSSRKGGINSKSAKKNIDIQEMCQAKKCVFQTFQLSIAEATKT